MPHRVLVTGSSGAIGRVACRALLDAGHQVRGFDRGPGPAGVEHVFGNLLDAWRLQEAAQGCDTLIHLAATPDHADMVTDLVPNNISGTWHALEAARGAGMRRIILASTLRVIGGMKDAEVPITVADGYHARDAYALSKVMVEEMGRHMHQQHGLSIVCARFGWFMRNRREAEGYHHFRARDAAGADRWYLSHDDCARFFVAAVEHQQVGFAPVFVVSHNNGQHWSDTTGTGAVIGWSPRDSWPEGTPADVAGETP